MVTGTYMYRVGRMLDFSIAFYPTFSSLPVSVLNALSTSPKTPFSSSLSMSYLWNITGGRDEKLGLRAESFMLPMYVLLAISIFFDWLCLQGLSRP